jgi:hypothetical protein
MKFFGIFFCIFEIIKASTYTFQNPTFPLYPKTIKLGAKEASINIARKMLFKGSDLEDIIDVTGLTKEEIGDLLQKSY